MVDVVPVRHADLEEIGAGDEGYVFLYKKDPDFVIKYLDNPPPDLRDRIAAMLALAPARWGGRDDTPDHLFVSWPLAVATFDFDDNHAKIRGVVSPAVKGPRELVHLVEDRGSGPRLLPNSREWVTVAHQIAYTTARLHEANIVVGDFSKRNVLLTHGRAATFVDADSMQFTVNGRHYPATRHTEEYSPPEYFNAGQYTREGDCFGLAVLVIEMLLGGDHPYAGAIPRGASTLPENLRANRNRVTTPSTLLPAPGRLPALEVLPPEVRDLAMQALGPGFTDPTLRPSAQRWRDALGRLHANLRQCGRLDTHQFSNQVAACPFCRMDADPFPSTTPPKLPRPTPPTVVSAPPPPPITPPVAARLTPTPPPVTPPPPPVTPTPPPVTPAPAPAVRPAAASSSGSKRVAGLVGAGITFVILKYLKVI